MRKLLLTFLWIAVSVMPLWAAKAYEMEVLNLIQVNETEFTFDVRMRNTNPSEPFAIEAIQWQLSFNTALMNGGSLNNAYLTYVNGTTDLVGVIVPNSLNFSTNQIVIQWITDVLLDGAVTTFFGDGNWKRIGTFRVQLRNAGNTAFHNFADVVHNLDFVPSQVIVNSCDYIYESGEYKRNGAPFELITGKTLTNSLSSRQLAGYCFSGTGAWDSPAPWNNVTLANSHTLPGASNNALIAGRATVNSAQTVDELTVANGAYLVLEEEAELTTSIIYNENPAGGAGTAVTLAGWDFQNASTSAAEYPYYADFGSTSNVTLAPFTTTANPMPALNYSSSGGTIAARAQAFYVYDEDYDEYYYYDWNIQVNTMGFQNLRISSKQRSTSTGPLSFQLQWSTDGTVWNDVSGGAIAVDLTWTTGAVSNLPLPAELSNKNLVYIRWLNTSHNGIGSSAIDDIIITGEPLPTGLLIQSTASGTGSLIHGNVGVDAVVQRNLPGGVNAWHMISSPVSGMAITGSGWDPGAIGAPNDMYLWNEPLPGTWVNFKNQDGSGGDPSFPAANGGNNFATGRGYIVNYNEANPTKEFEGQLHAGTVNVSLTVSPTMKDNWSWRAGWNLIGNPYASGLDFSEISTTGILAENHAHAYDPAYGGGAGGYVQVTTMSPGQGFFVKAAAGSGNSVLTFAPQAQVHAGSLFKQGASGAADRLVLRLSDGQFFDETKVIVNEASVKEHDFYDATKLFSYNPTAPQLYTRIEEERPLTVNSIPEANNGVAIPLSARIKSTGLFTLSIVETAGLLAGQPVILEDLFTGSDHQLDENPYVFSATEGDNADRFILKFGSVGVEDGPSLPAQIYCSNKVLYVRHSGNVTVDVINMAGQVVEHQDAPEGDLYTKRLGLPSGTYLVRVVGPNGVSTALIVL